MRRIELPDGAWIDIRGKEELTVAGKRGIQTVGAGLVSAMPKLKDVKDGTDMSELGLTEQETDSFLRMQEATVAAFLMGWSFPEPIPTLASIGGMNADRYEAISIATAKDGALVASLALDTSVGEGTPDPKEPSGAFEPSSGPSKDEAEPSPTLT